MAKTVRERVPWLTAGIGVMVYLLNLRHVQLDCYSYAPYSQHPLGCNVPDLSYYPDLS